MTLVTLLHTALFELRTNWRRSVLTILGIVIGVGAIVLTLSLGRGAQQIIVSQVQGVGGDTIVVRPGREPEGPSDFADTILSDSLKRADIAALRRQENVPHAVAVVPSVVLGGSVAFADNVYRPLTLGWQAEALGRILHIFPEEGLFFDEEDIRGKAKVAVLGWRVKQELYGDSQAVGKTVTLKNTAFRVVGVLPKSGQVSLFNPDELVLIPYSTGQELLGIDYFHEVMVQADDPAVVDEVADSIRATLRERHNISDSAKDDFFVLTQQDILQRLQTVTQVLTLFLTAIAAISLVVGGVGIMNIMLVSVTERTREIGLRKAVGATNADIRRQFLIETLLLTLSGGLVGALGATALSGIVAVVAVRQFSLAWPYEVPWLAIGIGITMAALVGLAFGLYPATAAARKNPIDALRYE